MAFIEPCFGIGHNLSLICQMTSEDIKHQLIIIIKRGDDNAPYTNGDDNAPYANGDDNAPYANGDDNAPYANGDDNAPYANGDDNAPICKW